MENPELYPSEFQHDNKLNVVKVLTNHGFNMARMISGSKSGYRQRYPENKVVFNANIIIPSEGKVWYGDLDITLDHEKLLEVVKEINEPLYILQEFCCRFGEEDKTKTKELMSRAVYTINLDGSIKEGKTFLGYTLGKNGQMNLF